jgi:hypothetical protein
MDAAEGLRRTAKRLFFWDVLRIFRTPAWRIGRNAFDLRLRHLFALSLSIRSCQERPGRHLSNSRLVIQCRRRMLCHRQGTETGRAGFQRSA